MKEHDHVANAIVFTNVFSIESKIVHRTIERTKPKGDAKSVRTPVPLSNQPLPESCEISSNAIQIEIIDRRAAIERRFGRICIGIRREIVQPRTPPQRHFRNGRREGRRGASSIESSLKGNREWKRFPSRRINNHRCDLHKRHCGAGNACCSTFRSVVVTRQGPPFVKDEKFFACRRTAS